MNDEVRKPRGNLAVLYAAYKDAEAKRDDAEEAFFRAENTMAEAWNACEEELSWVVNELSQ